MRIVVGGTPVEAVNMIELLVDRDHEVIVIEGDRDRIHELEDERSTDPTSAACYDGHLGLQRHSDPSPSFNSANFILAQLATPAARESEPASCRIAQRPRAWRSC